MTVYFETFGCRLNRAEALDEEAAYIENGWHIATSPDQADLIILRGCSVTAKAQHDCEKRISQLKSRFPSTSLRICGCLEAKTGEAVSRPLIKIENPIIESSLETASPVPTRTARAYLKAQDGCDCRCSFCIVPMFRGNSVSMSFTALLDKAQRFIDAGYHEIVLTGCNLALYASEGKRLPELVSALAERSTDCRVRLGSVEPGSIAIELTDVIHQHNNICRFLHLSVQSFSDHILKLMRRPYTSETVRGTFAAAIKADEHIALAADLIAGFPNESEADHQLSVEAVRSLPFANLHVFPYSERPGTDAAKMSGAVPVAERRRRAAELASLADEKRRAFASAMVGRRVRIVVEDAAKGAGWCGERFWCVTDSKAPRKSFADVLISAANGDQLIGKGVR